MNKRTLYSDEHINAYIDGELDNDERAILLTDEQNDEILSRRINKARTLKEKVQLAYADVTQPTPAKTPLRCTTFIRENSSLAAVFLISFITLLATFYNYQNNNAIQHAKQLIASSTTVLPQQLNHTIGDHKKIVLNITKYQPALFGDLLQELELLLSQNDIHIEIVASNNGLKMLDEKTSLHAKNILSLKNKFDNLDIVACAKSMSTLLKSDNPVQLIKSIMTTPSAAQQVAKRTRQGWLFIKI